MASFADNVVIITGASVGIGRELALQLSDQGARVVLASRDAAKLADLETLCRERGGQALAIPTDVADRSQCRSLIEGTIDKFGRIDTLINNAGITMWTRLDEIEDPDLLERLMRVNYFGSVHCTFFALPFLKETRGRLVCVASLAGKTGVPWRTGYAASKHALVGFFDSLRIELVHQGVTVTVINPGFVKTEVHRRAAGPDGRPLGKSPLQEDKVMSADTCARLILGAALRRRREVVMTARGRVGLWMKLIVPGLVDRIARRAIVKGR